MVYERNHTIIKNGDSMGLNCTEPLRLIGVKIGDEVTLKVADKKIYIEKAE